MRASRSAAIAVYDAICWPASAAPPSCRYANGDGEVKRAFYVAAETVIIIHAVRHAARDPSGMPGSA